MTSLKPDDDEEKIKEAILEFWQLGYAMTEIQIITKLNFDYVKRVIDDHRGNG
tara:strand:+ start:501 stop:659 length:159 start_codon:yes stop_codon:yes gene_type:complete